MPTHATIDASTLKVSESEGNDMSIMDPSKVLINVPKEAIEKAIHLYRRVGGCSKVGHPV